MKLLAIVFKFILKIKPLRKHYFGIYKKFILPKKIFSKTNFITKYDSTLKIKVNLSDWIQQQIFFLDYSDINGISFLKKTLKKDNVFIDIGANIGAYTLIASKLVEKTGMVIAFEPVNTINKMLIENIMMNDLTNITVEKKAVYDQNTNLELFISNEQNMGMSSILNHSHESGEKQKIEAITLDNYVQLKKLAKIDLVKIDIEGAEIHALKGMKQSLVKFKPTLIIEISDGILENSSVKSNAIYDFLFDLNYVPYNIDEKGNIKDFSSKDINYHNYIFLTKSN